MNSYRFKVDGPSTYANVVVGVGGDELPLDLAVQERHRLAALGPVREAECDGDALHWAIYMGR